MLPIDPNTDPINADTPEGVEKRAQLPEDFFCIITDAIIIDAVMLGGRRADRWSCYQLCEDGEHGVIPHTTARFEFSKLESNQDLQDKIDLILAPDTIEKREQYHRSYRLQQKLNDFPRKIGISANAWDQAPEPLYALVSEYPDEMEKLFFQSKLTWDVFITLNAETLSLIAQNFSVAQKFMEIGVSAQELMNTPRPRLLTLFENRIFFERFLDTQEITYANLAYASDSILEALIHHAESILPILQESQWIPWFELPDDIFQFVIQYINRAHELKKQLPDLTGNFILQHFDLFQSLVHHPEFIKKVSWYGCYSKYLFPQFTKQLAYLQRDWQAEGREPDFEKNRDAFAKALAEKGKQLYEFGWNNRYFENWYNLYLSCKKREIEEKKRVIFYSFPPCSYETFLIGREERDLKRESKLLEYIQDFRNNDHTLSAYEKEKIEEYIIQPLIATSVKYNVCLISEYNFTKLKLHFKDSYIYDLASIFTNLTEQLGRVFHAKAIPDYCKEALKNMPIKGLIAYLFDPDRSNDFQAATAKGGIISGLFIEFVMHEFFMYVNHVADYKYKGSAKKILLGLHDFLYEKYKEIDSAYKKQPDLKIWPPSSIDCYQMILSEQVIHNFYARTNGPLQVFVLILNIFLFIAIPIIPVICGILCLYDRKKYDIFFLPPTKTVRQAKVWHKELEQLKNFYVRFNASKEPVHEPLPKTSRNSGETDVVPVRLAY